MKKLTQQTLLLVICFFPAMQAQSSIVGFSAVSQTINVGETLEISIFANEFDVLAGGLIDFNFSSLAFLSVDNVAVDSLWDFDPVSGAQTGNNWQGLGFDVFTNDPLNGDGLIAKISITAIQAGITTFTLLNTSEFFSTTEQLDTSLIIDPVGFEITVQPVPLPAAIWMMGVALIGLTSIRSKKQN